MIEIEALRKSKQRVLDFFKAKCTNKSDQIPLNTFRDSFKDLGANVFNGTNDEFEVFLMSINTLICQLLFIQSLIIHIVIIIIIIIIIERM